METEDRQQHRMLQKEYGSLYRAVSDILFQHNVMELEDKHNTGNYDSEVDLLLLRFREANDLESLHSILYQVFRNSFGEESCGSPDRYDGPAAEIWQAYQRHRKMRDAATPA